MVLHNGGNTLTGHTADSFLHLILIIRGGFFFGRLDSLGNRSLNGLNMDLQSETGCIRCPVISGGQIIIIRNDNNVFLLILVSELN